MVYFLAFWSYLPGSRSVSPAVRPEYYDNYRSRGYCFVQRQKSLITCTAAKEYLPVIVQPYPNRSPAHLLEMNIACTHVIIMPPRVSCGFVHYYRELVDNYMQCRPKCCFYLFDTWTTSHRAHNPQVICRILLRLVSVVFIVITV